MSDPEPSERYSPEPNVLERKAAEYLSRLNEGHEDEWRERTESEVAEMERIIRWSVAYAAIAGIISGGIIGGVEVWIRLGIFDGQMDQVGWREQLPYWVGFFAVAGVISAIEIAALYATAIRGVGKLSNTSGIGLRTAGHSELLSRGLARAALEFPNPRVHVYGIDPYAYMSNWWIMARSVAYKMKVGVTSFLLRVFLRRVLARMAIRGIVPLVAGPLYALWNAIIVWRIMHEARLRALSPFAVEQLVGQISSETKRPGPRAVEVMMHGVGEMFMRGHDAHPNQVLLMSRLQEELGFESDTVEVDWEARLEDLRALGPHEQEAVLKVLTLSSILGSKTYKQQKELLHEAHEASGFKFDTDELERLRKQLKKGRGVSPDDHASVRR